MASVLGVSGNSAVDKVVLRCSRHSVSGGGFEEWQGQKDAAASYSSR